MFFIILQPYTEIKNNIIMTNGTNVAHVTIIIYATIQTSVTQYSLFISSFPLSPPSLPPTSLLSSSALKGGEEEASNRSSLQL